MNAFIKEFIQDEDGVSLIEYGLIAAVVGVGSITALTNLKTGINKNFDTTKTKLETTY